MNLIGVILSIVAVLVIVFVVAYITVLIDTVNHYKMVSERFEELYFGEVRQKEEEI